VIAAFVVIAPAGGLAATDVKTDIKIDPRTHPRARWDRFGPCAITLD